MVNLLIAEGVPDRISNANGIKDQMLCQLFQGHTYQLTDIDSLLGGFAEVLVLGDNARTFQRLHHGPVLKPDGVGLPL